MNGDNTNRVKHAPVRGATGGAPAPQWLDEPTGAGWYWVAGWMHSGPMMLQEVDGEWSCGPAGKWADSAFGYGIRDVEGRRVRPAPEPPDA